MTRKLAICVILITFAWPSFALAQDNKAPKAPVTFELDEEKLTIEADIPSVDLIISFRELQERNNRMAKSFLNEIVQSAKDEPF